jgi:hypothetical protein
MPSRGIPGLSKSDAPRIGARRGPAIARVLNESWEPAPVQPSGTLAALWQASGRELARAWRMGLRHARLRESGRFYCPVAAVRLCTWALGRGP